MNFAAAQSLPSDTAIYDNFYYETHFATIAFESRLQASFLYNCT